jgi:hypothetical protein
MDPERLRKKSEKQKATQPGKKHNVSNEDRERRSKQMKAIRATGNAFTWAGKTGPNKGKKRVYREDGSFYFDYPETK